MQQTSLTQAYRNLFPNMTGASIPAVTMLKSGLNMYILEFFLIACFVNSSPDVTFLIALVLLALMCISSDHGT
jgi:hypothetical protein